MSRIVIDTPAGSFSTGLPEVAQMFLRRPASFGHCYGAALDGSLDESQVQRLAQCIERAAVCVDGHREEIATGIAGLLIHVEPMWRSD
jgi:hypothetical protein